MQAETQSSGLILALSGFVSPVRRWGLDAPHIAWRIEREPEEPKTWILSNLDTVDDVRCYPGSPRKALEFNCRTDLERTAETGRTSLGVHQHCQTGLGERVSRIQILQRKRNLTVNSGSTAGPRRTGR